MRIAFSWSGLPQYAARLIRAALSRLDQECIVIGSTPGVPVRGMEQMLGQEICWVDPSRPISWVDLGFDVPEIFIQSGWVHPAFTSLGREVKAGGGKVIGLSDANWRGDFRQLVFGFLGFRMRYRKYFDAIMVPGQQGMRLMRYFGMPNNKIGTGMYGADPEIFNGGPPLDNREKKFLFVGQFVERKNVLGLVDAFRQFTETNPNWVLHLCGTGKQRGMIPNDKNIIVEDFVQPEDLASRYRSARFFVLPSFVEAWGLVVHEAALCGCGLVLSDAVGSLDDLGGERNLISYKAKSKNKLESALREASNFDAKRLEEVEKESRQMASAFGPEKFAKEITNLMGNSDRLLS